MEVVDHTDDFLAQHLGNLLSRQPIIEPKTVRTQGSEACSDSDSIAAQPDRTGSEAEDELTRLVISATRNQVERDQAAAELEAINQGRILAAQRFDKLQRRSAKGKSDPPPKGHRRTASEWASTGEGRHRAWGSLAAQSDGGTGRKLGSDRSSEPPVAADLISESPPHDVSEKSPSSSREPGARPGDSHHRATDKKLHSRDFATENIEQGIEGPREDGKRRSPTGSPCVQWPNPFDVLGQKGNGSASSNASDSGRDGASSSSGPRYTSMQTKLPPPNSFGSRMRLFGDRSSAARLPGADIVAPPRVFSSDGRASDTSSITSHVSSSASGVEDPGVPADGEEAIRAQIATGAAVSTAAQGRTPQPAKRLTLVPVGEDGRSFRFVETPIVSANSAGEACDRIAANCTDPRSPSPTMDTNAPANSMDDRHMSRSTSLGSLPSGRRYASTGNASEPGPSRPALAGPSSGSSDSKTASFTFGTRAGGFSVSYGSFRASTRRDRPSPSARATRSEAAPRRSPSRSSSPAGEDEARRSSHDQTIDEIAEHRRQSEPTLVRGNEGSGSDRALDLPVTVEQPSRRSSPSSSAHDSGESCSTSAYRPPTCQDRLGLSHFGRHSSSLSGTSNSSPTNGSQSALANSEANDSEETELTSNSEGGSPSGQSEAQEAGPILERSSTWVRAKLRPLPEHRESEGSEVGRASSLHHDCRDPEQAVA